MGFTHCRHCRFQRRKVTLRQHRSGHWPTSTADGSVALRTEMFDGEQWEKRIAVSSGLHESSGATHDPQRPAGGSNSTSSPRREAHHTGQDRRRRETSRQGEQHQIGTRTFYRPFTSNGTDAFRPALRLPFRLPNHKSAGFDAILYSSLKRVVATSDRASHALAKIAPSRFTSSSHSRYSIHIIIPLLHSSGGPISPCYRSQKSHANRIVRPK